MIRASSSITSSNTLKSSSRFFLHSTQLSSRRSFSSTNKQSSDAKTKSKWALQTQRANIQANLQALDRSTRSTRAPFQEVKGANKATAELLKLLIGRETTQTPLRLSIGLASGYVAGGMFYYYLMGCFDIGFLLSTSIGSLAYLGIVGGAWGPVWFFVSCPIVLFLGFSYYLKEWSVLGHHHLMKEL